MLSLLYSKVNIALLKVLDSNRTYAMLKPEVIERMGRIIAFIEGKGFRFNKMMLTKIGAIRAAEFYKEHTGRPFYE